MVINSQAPFIKEREVMTDKEDAVRERRLAKESGMSDRILRLDRSCKNP